MSHLKWAETEIVHGNCRLKPRHSWVLFVKRQDLINLTAISKAYVSPTLCAKDCRECLGGVKVDDNLIGYLLRAGDTTVHPLLLIQRLFLFHILTH